MMKPLSQQVSNTRALGLPSSSSTHLHGLARSRSERCKLRHVCCLFEQHKQVALDLLLISAELHLSKCQHNSMHGQQLLDRRSFQVGQARLAVLTADVTE